MNIIKNRYFHLIIISIAVLIFLSNYLEVNNSNTKFEKLKKVLEAPFYKQGIEDDILFKIVKKPSGEFRDYFIFNQGTVSMISGQFPQLLCILNNKFYFSNNFQGLRVFNVTGECIYKFNYSPNYFVNYANTKIDDSNNLYLWLTNNEDTTNVLVYRINDSFERQELNDAQMKSLSANTELRKLDINIDLGINEVQSNYRMEPMSDFSLIKNDNGRLLSIATMNLYKNDILLDNLNLEILPEKIIFTKLYYLDSLENLYLIGFKSNDFERISDYSFHENKIKILNPVFFIWKLEN